MSGSELRRKLAAAKAVKLRPQYFNPRKTAVNRAVHHAIHTQIYRHQAR